MGLPMSRRYRFDHRSPFQRLSCQATRTFKWNVIAFWSAEASPWAIDGPASRAPEICIVVASPANSQSWLARKAAAFIAAGAQEVIVVAVDGLSARYYHADGEHESSRFAQLSFPLLDSVRP